MMSLGLSLEKPQFTIEPICTANCGRSKPADILLTYGLIENDLYGVVDVISSGTQAGSIIMAEQGDWSATSPGNHQYILGKIINFVDQAGQRLTGNLTSEQRDEIAADLKLLGVTHDSFAYNRIAHLATMNPNAFAHDYNTHGSFRAEVIEWQEKVGNRLGDMEVAHRQHFLEQWADMDGVDKNLALSVIVERLTHYDRTPADQTIARPGRRILWPMAGSNLAAVVGELGDDGQYHGGIYDGARLLDVEGSSGLRYGIEDVEAEPVFEGIQNLLAADDNVGKNVLVARPPVMVMGVNPVTNDGQPNPDANVADAFGVPLAYGPMSKGQLVPYCARTVKALAAALDQAA